MRRVIPMAASFMIAATVAWCGEIQFIEDFALASDRTAVLKQLIPGTEDFYYFHALHSLNTEQFEKVRESVGPWHAKARAIATKYADHPADRWRNTFASITAQLDEAEGKGADAKPMDVADRAQQQNALAAPEPNFDFTVEAKQINLNFQNLKSVRVNFYERDVELLFSRNPFVQQFSGQFRSIKPNLSMELKLEDDAQAAKVNGHLARTIPLPDSLHNKNVLVEIIGAGQTKSQAYYSHSLAVQVIENHGQLKVTHLVTGKPVPKAYVKVYAQTNDGQVKFYKDGYTDLRGRFDYASLNTGDLDFAGKFSMLILSEANGTLVREANPPKQ